MTSALRTTALSILREPVYFDTFHKKTAHAPKCNICQYDCDRPFMRMYNQNIHETVHLCRKKCYLAYLSFYFDVCEERRLVDGKHKEYKERFNTTYDKSKEKVERSLWTY